MIYVDPPQKTLTIVRWCHMMTDNSDTNELHLFAKRIGMKRHWFQDHPLHPHYDLTAGMRARAIRAGAIPVSSVELINKCKYRKQVLRYRVTDTEFQYIERKRK